MHPRFQAWLRFKNSEKFNVYCGVNAIAPWKRTRANSVGAVRHVFLEADFDGPAVLARIGARSDLPEPSYAIRRRTAYFWRVTGFGAEQVERLQKVLARELDTDPAATPVTQTSSIGGLPEPQVFACPPRHDRLRSRGRRVRPPTDFPSVESVVRTAATSDRQPTRALAASARTNGLIDPRERARRYLARVPPAVAGEHGDVHTFRVCCRLVRGFALDDQEALTVLTEWTHDAYLVGRI